MKTFIWFETLIIVTLYTIISPIIRGIISYFQTLTDTCNWYSKNDVHIYQPTKARQIYSEQYEKAMIEKLKEFDNGK